LLAALCFGKSSQRVHHWFVSTRLYKNNIEDFVEKRAMTVKSKTKLLMAITAAMGLSFVLIWVSTAPSYPKVVLAVVWLLHVLYFGFWVKTIR